jgi:hypothetical protein
VKAYPVEGNVQAEWFGGFGVEALERVGVGKPSFEADVHALEPRT